MKNKKSFINSLFFCSEFQSVSRIVKIVHSSASYRKAYIVLYRRQIFLSLFACSRNQLRLIKRQKKLTMTAISVTSRSNLHQRFLSSSIVCTRQKNTIRRRVFWRKKYSIQFENCKIITCLKKNYYTIEREKNRLV